MGAVRGSSSLPFYNVFSKDSANRIAKLKILLAGPFEKRIQLTGAVAKILLLGTWRAARCRNAVGQTDLFDHIALRRWAD